MPQVSPHADQAAAQAEHEAEQQDQQHLLRPEEDQPGEGPAAAVPEEQVSGVAEQQREQATQRPLQRALEEEGAPDEPVGGTHQPHDTDLAGALQQGEPDGDADDHDRHRRERQADDQADQPGDVAQVIELADPVPAEADVLHEAEAAKPLGHPLHVGRVAVALLETYLDGGRQRIHLQVAVRVAKLDQLLPSPRQRLLLADEDDVLHLGERRDVLGRQGDRLGRRAAEHEGDDLHPLLQSPQRLAQVDGHQPEQAHGKEREGDGGDREHREQGRAAEGEQGLTGEQPHGAASAASASSSALS
jgi:hypothetical protein